MFLEVFPVYSSYLITMVTSINITIVFGILFFFEYFLAVRNQQWFDFWANKTESSWVFFCWGHKVRCVLQGCSSSTPSKFNIASQVWWCRWHSSSNGPFSGAMLNFGGVVIRSKIIIARSLRDDPSSKSCRHRSFVFTPEKVRILIQKRGLDFFWNYVIHLNEEQYYYNSHNWW